MTLLFILAIAGFVYGGWLGMKRATRKLAVENAKTRSKTEKRGRARVNASADAPAEMSQAELKAMGSWFKE